MLLRTLFLAIFIIAIGDTVVYAASAIARTSYHARQIAALRNGLTVGISDAQQAAATGAVPAPTSTCAFANAGGCALTVAIAVAVASPAPATTSCPAVTCTVLLQNNSAVVESRAAFVVSAAVVAGNGDVLARRAAAVSFRTFAQPPYASLVGSLDETLDAAIASGNGDDGGNAAGTLIHVRYQGAAGTVSGDVWKAHAEQPSGAAAAWDP